MTSNINRLICAQLVLQKTFPEAEIARLERKAAWMRAQDGKLTPDQDREDRADRERNEAMGWRAVRTLESLKTRR